MLVRLVVAVFVARRLTELVTEDRVTEDLRNRWVEHFGADSKLGYLITCRRCVSIWAGMAAWFLTGGKDPLSRLIVGTLTASDLVGVVDDVLPGRLAI